MLKREEVKQKLIEWGVAEPTDEMINDFLATNSKELKSAEDRANRYKADSDKMAELQKQLDALNNEKLTDAEKSAKAVEEAQKKVAELEKTVSSMKLLNSLAEIGITGDDATSLVGENGLDVAKLGEILAAREKNAVAAYQKQALDNTPSPNGGKEEEPDKPYKDIVDRVVASKKTENDASSIVDAYK